MVELRERLDRVLEKARFTVSVFSPVEMKTEPLGGFSTQGRSVSEEELSPKGLAKLYEESRSGLRRSTWVQHLASENDDGAMAALTGELRTVLGAFVEPNLDAVGHALHWLPTQRGFTKGVPSGLHVAQAISPVAELAEALVIAGGCLGSERACEYIWAWVEGESLGLPHAHAASRCGSRYGTGVRWYPHRLHASLDERASLLPSDRPLRTGPAVSGQRRDVGRHSRRPSVQSAQGLGRLGHASGGAMGAR